MIELRQCLSLPILKVERNLILKEKKLDHIFVKNVIAIIQQANQRKNMIPNLWNDIILIPNNTIKILNQQAEYLAIITKNVLGAKVKAIRKSSETNGEIKIGFFIIAEKMAYEYRLFFIKQSISKEYPFTIHHQGTATLIEEEEQFIQKLKEIFALPTTSNIVSTLYLSSAP